MNPNRYVCSCPGNKAIDVGATCGKTAAEGYARLIGRQKTGEEFVVKVREYDSKFSGEEKPFRVTWTSVPTASLDAKRYDVTSDDETEPVGLDAVDAVETEAKLLKAEIKRISKLVDDNINSGFDKAYSVSYSSPATNPLLYCSTGVKIFGNELFVEGTVSNRTIARIARFLNKAEEEWEKETDRRLAL